MSLEVSSIVINEASLGQTDDVNSSIQIKNTTGFPIYDLFLEILPSDKDYSGNGLIDKDTIKIYNVSACPDKMEIGQAVDIMFKIKTINTGSGNHPITVKMEYKIVQESVRNLKVNPD